MKWIVGGAVLGWAGIVALAWHLAGARIAFCQWDGDCMVRTTAARDATLIYGLSFGLLGAIGFGLIVAFRNQRLNRSEHAPREARRTERTKLLM